MGLYRDVLVIICEVLYKTGNGVVNGNGVAHGNGHFDDEFQPQPPSQKDEDEEKEKKKTDAVGVLELFSFADKWDVFWICLG